VYFTDRDLGKRFPEILRASGLNVERHADHFPPETPDEVWLEEVGKRGWIALTHDQRIRYKPNERDAVMRHRVALLVVVGKAPFSDLARSLVALFHALNTSSRNASPLSSPKSIDPRLPMCCVAQRLGVLSSGILEDSCEVLDHVRDEGVYCVGLTPPC
jgi:hypothetical protein